MSEQLVTINSENGQPVVSSREVAEHFGKEHKNVLETVRNLAAENSAAKSWFFESTFQDRGKSYPMYLMNRDGFSLLVMGFTGKEALEWKVKYIQAFNAMEKKLAEAHSLTTPMSKELQAIFMLDNRSVQHEQRITALEGSMVIDYGQQRTLATQVNMVVLHALGGADSPAYNDKTVRGRTYSERNRDIQQWFRVNSRNNIPRKRFDEAIEYIQRWHPSANLAMTIRQANGQTSLFAAS